MKNKVYHFLPAFVLLLVILTGCNLSSTQEPPVVPSQPTQTPEPVEQAAATNTAVPPTNTTVPPTNTPIPPTDTPTATFTQTDPPTSTPTDIPTSTPTQEPASLVVERDAVCRSGPGLDYNIVGYQSAGDIPDVIAKSDTDPLWWVIAYEGKADPCWIADEIVSVAGAVASLPVSTPPPTPTAAAPSGIEGEGIYYFLVAENTGGPFGCGDSLLYIYPGIERTGDSVIDIQRALTALFANKHQYYNGLYNPTYRSSFTVTDVDIVDGEIEMQVYLRGDFAVPIDKCDALRMRAQIWETIETQNPESQHAVIFLNNALLGDKLVMGW